VTDTPRAIETVRPASLHADVPYAYATVVPAGSLVLTAGACPIDEHGVVVEPGDVAAQARRVMANLSVVLRESGCSLTDVVRTTVYVASDEQPDLVAAWEVVRAAFGEWDPPSTLLGVATLGWTGQLVEVEATAVRRDS
jgi:enamine deaminase RidA (YjgF/YER057c/UK114 family)